MRLWNGMWHDLRNCRIIRNEKYAEWLKEINLCTRLHTQDICFAHSRHLLYQSSTLRTLVVPIHTCSSCSSCGNCSLCSCFCFEVNRILISLLKHVFSGGSWEGTLGTNLGSLCLRLPYLLKLYHFIILHIAFYNIKIDWGKKKRLNLR